MVRDWKLLDDNMQIKHVERAGEGGETLCNVRDGAFVNKKVHHFVKRTSSNRHVATENEDSFLRKTR